MMILCRVLDKSNITNSCFLTDGPLPGLEIRVSEKQVSGKPVEGEASSMLGGILLVAHPAAADHFTSHDD